MVAPDGTPNVVEFNCRLRRPGNGSGAPAGERRAARPRFEAVARGQAPPPLEVAADRFAVTTVLASEGYPDKPMKGQPIDLPESFPHGVHAFHAGTTRDVQGVLRVSGGRVFAVTGLGATFEEAQARSRAGAESIHYQGKIYRSDIGWREAERDAAGCLT